MPTRVPITFNSEDGIHFTTLKGSDPNKTAMTASPCMAMIEPSVTMAPDLYLYSYLFLAKKNVVAGLKMNPINIQMSSGQGRMMSLKPIPFMANIRPNTSSVAMFAITSMLDVKRSLRSRYSFKPTLKEPTDASPKTANTSII